MKNRIINATIGSILIFISHAGFSQGNFTLEINIDDLNSDNGKIMIQISDENEKTLSQQVASIKNGTCKVVFDSLPTGNYAVRYYHDENSNGELDTGTFGIPEEGYGFSNDARGFMGPPSFEDQLFDLTDDKTMTLKTKY